MILKHRVICGSTNEVEQIATGLQVQFDNEHQQSQFDNEYQQSSETTSQVIISIPTTSVSPGLFSLFEISSYLKNRFHRAKQVIIWLFGEGKLLNGV